MMTRNLNHLPNLKHVLFIDLLGIKQDRCNHVKTILNKNSTQSELIKLNESFFYYLREGFFKTASHLNKFLTKSNGRAETFLNSNDLDEFFIVLENLNEEDAIHFVLNMFSTFIQSEGGYSLAYRLRGHLYLKKEFKTHQEGREDEKFLTENGSIVFISHETRENFNKKNRSSFISITIDDEHLTESLKEKFCLETPLIYRKNSNYLGLDIVWPIVIKPIMEKGRVTSKNYKRQLAKAVRQLEIEHSNPKQSPVPGNLKKLSKTFLKISKLSNSDHGKLKAIELIATEIWKLSPEKLDGTLKFSEECFKKDFVRNCIYLKQN